MYEQGDAPNFSVECWTSVRNTLGLDFPTIPYLIDGEARVTDPNAIMLYVATAYAPELLGSSPEESAEIDMIYSQLKDLKSAITGPCYIGQDRAVLKELAMKKMKPIVDYMGKKEYLIGSKLTYLDFYMLELCDFVQWLTDNEFFNVHKSVARYVKKMKSIRQIKKYIMSDRFVEKPYNNKVAKINNM